MRKRKVSVREFEATDAQAVAECVHKSLAPFQGTFPNWEESADELTNVTAHTATSAIWVAEYDSKVVGVARQSPKAPFIEFRSRVRLLVGSPDYSGLEIERALIQVCIWKAREGSAAELALSIHPECRVAIASALKIGFRKEPHKSRVEMPFERYVLPLR